MFNKKVLTHIYLFFFSFRRFLRRPNVAEANDQFSEWLNAFLFYFLCIIERDVSIKPWTFSFCSQTCQTSSWRRRTPLRSPLSPGRGPLWTVRGQQSQCWGRGAHRSFQRFHGGRNESRERRMSVLWGAFAGRYREIMRTMISSTNQLFCYHYSRPYDRQTIAVPYRVLLNTFTDCGQVF